MTIAPGGRASFALDKKEIDTLCDAWRIMDNIMYLMESSDLDILVYGYQEQEEYCSLDKIRECGNTLDSVTKAWAIE